MDRAPAKHKSYRARIGVHATQHLEKAYEPNASIDFGLGSHPSFTGNEDYDALAPFELEHSEREKNVVDAAFKRQPSPKGSPNVEQAAYTYPEMPGLVGDHEDDSEYEIETVSAIRKRKANDADNNREAEYKLARKRNQPSTRNSPFIKLAEPERRPVASHRTTIPYTSASPSNKKLATVAPTGKSSSSLLGTGPLQCPYCKQSQFKDQAGLDNHVKQHTRPYHCVFHFAGCTSTFPTKNEWKRHVLSQHLLLYYWLCDEGVCSKLTKVGVKKYCNFAKNHQNSYISTK